MGNHIRNIFHLGVKELIELGRDWLMLVLILYSFSLGIYTAAKAQPDSLSNAAIAVVDEDGSQLSQRITDAFFPPMYRPAKKISLPEIDDGMDSGDYTFVLVIPPDFERDVIRENDPEIQLNVDATRISQAFTGAGYTQSIIQEEIAKYSRDRLGRSESPAQLVVRNRFNANLTASWFSAVNQLVNNITMLAIILTGAALIRERENGTLEHLQVMPVSLFDIMFAKIWSMMLVVLVASGFAMLFIVKGMLHVPMEGSLALFLCGIALHLFAVTSLGIFLACIAGNMPQLGMLLILVLLPMQMLSGGMTPQESMPEWVRIVMTAAPTTHFVSFSQSIIFRNAGLSVVWRPFLALLIIGAVLFQVSLIRFRKTA